MNINLHTLQFLEKSFLDIENLSFSDYFYDNIILIIKQSKRRCDIFKNKENKDYKTI